jgi:hypothetical protein
MVASRTLVLRWRHRPGQTRREAGTQSQGSPNGDRPAAEGADEDRLKESYVTMKTNLAFFRGQGSRILSGLSTVALFSVAILGGGQRWF